MTFPEKVKLTQAGESITVHVSRCALASVGKYPEVEFYGVAAGRQVVVPVPKASADRQLARLTLTYADCTDAVLTISRDDNKQDASKPYWGITIGTVAEGPPVRSRAPSNPLPPDDPAPHPADREGKAEPTPRELYLSITKDTLDHVLPLYLAKGILVDMQAVASMVATRYITATQRR